MIIMDGWHDGHRLTRKAWRNVHEIAEKCATDLGELPENDISHGKISQWLRKQPDVELK